MDTGDDSEGEKDDTGGLSVSEESTDEEVSEANDNGADTPSKKTDTEYFDSDVDNGKEDEYDYYDEGDYDDEEYNGQVFDYYYDASENDGEEEYNGEYDNGGVSQPEVRAIVNQSAEETRQEQEVGRSLRSRVGVIESGRGLYDDSNIDGDEEALQSSANSGKPDVTANQIESTTSPNIYFPRVDSMPKLMEEDMSDLFPLFHGNRDNEAEAHREGYIRESSEELEQKRREQIQQKVSEWHENQQTNGYSRSKTAEDELGVLANSHDAKITNSKTRSRGSHGKVVDSFEVREDRKVFDSDAQGDTREPYRRTEAEEVFEQGDIEEYEMRENKRKEVTSQGLEGTVEESNPERGPTTRRSVAVGEGNTLMEDSEENNKKGVVEELLEEEAEGLPATIEAVFTVKVLVRDCRVARKVSEVLQKGLLEQISCRSLTCHPPHTTCNQT